jgi:hypothetical protein
MVKYFSFPRWAEVLANEDLTDSQKRAYRITIQWYLGDLKKRRLSCGVVEEWSGEVWSVLLIVIVLVILIGLFGFWSRIGGMRRMESFVAGKMTMEEFGEEDLKALN